ncbi:MAG: electron transfer flavoprotein subunit alpha/FixB family protein, partial [Candidatus Promineifilaceae bacterium]
MADDTGWPLVALALGHQLEAVERPALEAGADEVLVIDHPLLADFCVDTYTLAAFQAIVSRRPGVLLVGATAGGRDLAGRLAVRLRTGLNADCTDLRLRGDPGVLVCQVSGYGGGVMALIEMAHHRPQMATVRPGVFQVAESDRVRHGIIRRLSLKLDPPATRARLVSRVVGQGVDLSSAPVLIVGGRGVDGNFKMLRRLADLLDGEVGATRPPVDEGYIGRHRQIGQTGVVCRPKVAIVCGASGAFHFVVGIQEAELIIAVNSDARAAIFDHADYGALADAQQIVPALIEALTDLGLEPAGEADEVVYG